MTDMQKAIAKVGAAAAAIAVVGTKLLEVAEESNRTKAVFNNLQFALDGAAKASLGLVDNMTLAQSQVTALKLGAVTTSAEFDTLAEAGAKLGFVLKGDAAGGLRDLTEGLAKGSPEILNNIGLIVDKTTAYEAYSRAIGVSVSALTTAQRQEAVKTEGLKQAKEMSDSLTIATNDLSFAAAQAAVEMENLKTQFIGGTVPATAKLNTVLEALGEELAGMDVAQYGTDYKKFDQILREHGTTISELGGRYEVQAGILAHLNKLTEEHAAAAEAATLAAEELAINLEAAYAKDAIDGQGQYIELLEAQGASERKISEAKRQQLILTKDLLLVQAELSNDVGAQAARELADIDRQIMLHDERAKTRRRRGGGSRKDPLADLFEARGDDGAAESFVAELIAEDEAAMEAAEARHMERFELAKMRRAQEEEAEQAAFDLRVERMQREIELAQVQGLETEFMEQRLLQIQLERAEANEDIGAREQLLHADKMRRLKEEQAELARRDAAIEKGTRMYVGALGAATVAAVEASDNKGQAFLSEVQQFAASRAKMMAIESLTHFALAAIWAAALNPVKASAELVAGGIAAAQATALGALAGGIGASVGGGSAAAATSAGVTPSTAGATSRPDSAGTAPVSPLEQNGSPVPQSSQGGSGGQVINLNVAGSFIDSGGQLKSLLDDASSNGGRALRGGVG